MSAMQNPHLLFFGNAAAHLVALMSGLISFLFGLWEKSKRKLDHIPRVYWVVSVICVIISFDLAWQDEHRNGKAWEDQRNGAYQERDFWKGQSYSKEAALQQKDILLEKDTSALAQTQVAFANLSNKVLDITRPEALHVYAYTSRLGIIKNPVVTEIVLITNRATVVRGVLHCDQAFDILDWWMAGSGVRMGVGTTQIGNNEYELRTMSPNWEPQAPVVVNVSSTETLRNCKFTPQGQ